jgi:hypothetical protein
MRIRLQQSKIKLFNGMKHVDDISEEKMPKFLNCFAKFVGKSIEKQKAKNRPCVTSETTPKGEERIPKI